MNKWRTLKSKFLHESPFGNVRMDTCELPNGLVINDYCVIEYSDWVNAVVITKENQMVLVEQYRHAGGDFFIEVPAGKKEGNETPEQGLMREIREETGYTSFRKPIYLGEFMVNPATQNNTVKTFLLLEAFEAFDQDLDNAEEITVRLFDFNTFGNAIMSNTVKTQLFTANAYYMAKSYMLENRIKIE